MREHMIETFQDRCPHLTDRCQVISHQLITTMDPYINPLPNGLILPNIGGTELGLASFPPRPLCFVGDTLGIVEDSTYRNGCEGDGCQKRKVLGQLGEADMVCMGSKNDISCHDCGANKQQPQQDPLASDPT